MINKDGDAVFNNITARGAIKTAVFEYAEIQAVGGVFIFRPSSTIKSARIADNEQDLIVKVEKPYLFAKIAYNEVTNPTGNPQEQNWYERTNYGYTKTNDETVDVEKTYYNRVVVPHSWCKISNYTNNGTEPDISSILANNGLTHVYEISEVDFDTKEITLVDAADMVSGQSAITTIEELEGGALIDMGRPSNAQGYDNGIHNYGIGVNSSDNTVNLPARAISLFETVIDPNQSIKVSYKYKGILGTLPELQYTGQNAQVHQLYHDYMSGTQGIYTNNMYIGDKNQYIAFYEKDGEKHLKISARDMIFGYEGGQEITWEDKISEAAESTIVVKIDSSNGEIFTNGTINTVLTCHVYRGTTEITSTVNSFKWIITVNGSSTETTTTSPTLQITTQPGDNISKEVIKCVVTIEGD